MGFFDQFVLECIFDELFYVESTLNLDKEMITKGKPKSVYLYYFSVLFLT